MKKLFLLILIPLFSFGQSKKFKKEYKRVLKSPAFLFMTDWRESNFDNLIYTKNILPQIISNSNKYGYTIMRGSGTSGSDKQFIYNDGIRNFIILKKSIYNFNYESFPGYSIGNIYKKIYFSGERIDEAAVSKVETEIELLQYSNVSASKIINYFEFVKNFIKRSYLERYNLESSSQKYNTKSMWGKYYDLVDINKIWKIKKGWGKIRHTLTIGNGTERRTNKDGTVSTFFKIVFSIENTEMNNLITRKQKESAQNDKSYNNLRFTIGGKDIRESNTYDLKSMVNVFLEDCKKNNITTPPINSLKATFEPLDGNKIALSYGLDNDSIIVIKVDPEKWEKSSNQKKWYILYHELGHDVLNLEHGEGGKMMYNFADRDYSWDEFFKDKLYMINSIK